MKRITRIAAALGSLCLTLTAQEPPVSGVRLFGDFGFDTLACDLPILDVCAVGDATAVLRSDGRILIQGRYAWTGLFNVPPAPPGFRYVDVEVGSPSYGYALLSDGSITGWGDPSLRTGHPLSIPPLPPGVTCRQLCAGALHVLVLGSDGLIRAYGDNYSGQCNVPALPPGATWLDADATDDHNLALRSDGVVVAWGDNWYGQCNVLPAPAGLRYVAISAGSYNGAAILSDGSIAVWGDNSDGQLNVPALPLGQTYVQCSTGGPFVVALRSDGQLVAWGDNQFGIASCPTPPPGATCLQVEAGSHHAMARWSNGAITGWGNNWVFQSFVPAWRPHNWRHLSADKFDFNSSRFLDAACGSHHALFLRVDGTLEAFGLDTLGRTTPPPLPPGTRYSKVTAGVWHSVALRSDGQLIYFGTQVNGYPNVPPLPTGITYTDVATSSAHTVALRSDGQAVSFGPAVGTSGTIPPLQPGLRYTQVDCAYDETLLLRSDGQVVGAGYYGWQPPAPLPPGVVYTDLAAGQFAHAVLRSDGLVDLNGNALPPPPLPWGVHYVEAEAEMGNNRIILRRSDGQLTVAPNSTNNIIHVPPLDPGTSYVDLGATCSLNFIARVGPTCTYTGYGHGCAGTRPTARIVPRDTPRIDATFEVNLFDLPIHTAILITSLQPTAPQDLASMGLPGCSGHLVPTVATFVAGQNHTARASFAIPNLPELVGLRFYQQAVVNDPSANQAGVVVSDAMEGVIGHW